MLIQVVQFVDCGTRFEEKRAVKAVRASEHKEAKIRDQIQLAVIAGPVPGAQSEG